MFGSDSETEYQEQKLDNPTRKSPCTLANNDRNKSGQQATNNAVALSGADPGGGPGGPGPPLTTKNEAPAPKFYKTEAPEWQF